MRLDRKYRQMIESRGLDWELRNNTRHHDLFIEGEYVYGFSMGSRITPLRTEVTKKIRKTVRRIENERRLNRD